MGHANVKNLIGPHTFIKFKEFNIVALEASRLYRNLPPKHSGRLIQASLDPFWQCLSGDLNLVRNLRQIAANAFRENRLETLHKVSLILRKTYYLVKEMKRERLGPVYRSFFLKEVKLYLSEARLWKNCIIATGINVNRRPNFGPLSEDFSILGKSFHRLI